MMFAEKERIMNDKFKVFLGLLFNVFVFIFIVSTTLASPTTLRSQAFNCKESEITQGYLFGKTAILGLEVNSNYLNILEAGTDEEFNNSLNEVSLTNEDTVINTMILVHEDFTTTYVYFLGTYQEDYLMFSVYHSVNRSENNDALSYAPECGYWLVTLESYSLFLDNVIEDNFN